MTTNAIISKVWSFCNTLRDGGVSYTINIRNRPPGNVLSYSIVGKTFIKSLPLKSKYIRISSGTP